MAFTYITGSGTQADPYVITNINGMNELSTYVNGGHNMDGEYVELGADIDYQNGSVDTEAYGTYNFKTFNTIGNSDYPFCGNFDGKSYTLKSINAGVFICSSSVCIKNVNIINFTGYSSSAIAYNGKYTTNKTPIIENIVFSTRPQASNLGYGSLFQVYKTTSSENFSNVTFTITKCFCYGIVGNNQSINYQSMVYLSDITAYNVTISDCVIINMVPFSANMSSTQSIRLINILAYFEIADFNYSKYPYNNYSNTVNVLNCYVAHGSTHTNIDRYFSLSWNRLTFEQCTDSSNFNGWDFTNTWQIDTGLEIPMITYAHNKFVYILATNGGTTDKIQVQGSGLGSRSYGFCYNFTGSYGLIKKGIDVNFGVTRNTSITDSLIYVNFVNIKNLTTEQTGEDYQGYLNIQHKLVYRYEITPCFDGKGTVSEPFLLKTYYDFRAILEYSGKLYYYCSYLSDFYGDYLSRSYASIENDIEINDVSNFNNWHNTAPTNQVNAQRTEININGNNHKIIGLYIINSNINFYNSTINNIKFDYLCGTIRFSSSSTNVYDCEFNGRFQFYGTSAIFNRCIINILPYNNILRHYNNCLCYNSSNDTSNPTFINCIINVSTSSLRTQYVNPTFTNCILLGTYYQNRYFNYSSNIYEYPAFNNSYIIDESVIIKDDISGLTYISYNTYIHSTTSMYNNFDFTNVFELYNKVINGNNEYITIPILKNMIPRYSFVSILNDDYYGLSSITNYYYMQKLPSYENTGESQLSVTVTPNAESYFSKWDDISSNNTIRTFTNYDDNYVTYNLLPNCGNLLTGKGTENEPYLITNKTDLINIINWFNTNGTGNQYRTNIINPCYFKITNDIEYQDCSNWQLWINSDASETFIPFRSFKGYIDGDNHTISGLYRSTFDSNDNAYYNDSQLASLFINSGSSTNNAIINIKNLKITKSVLKRTYRNYTTTNSNLSFINGNNCYLINCHFSGIIIANPYRVWIAGMAIVYQYLYADNCTSNIQIMVSDSGTTANYIELISGMFILVYSGSSYAYNNSTIKQCVNKSNIECTRTSAVDRFISGIIANDTSSASYSPVIDITETYNLGNITALNSRVGGIACSDAYDGNSRANITNCYNRGNITTTSSTTNKRGISGIEYRVSRNITNCYNYGNLIDTIDNTYVFAISCKDSSNVNVSNCYYLENTATNAGGGTALNAAQFAVTSNFTGFDFINTWEMDNAAGRPKLINNFEGELSTLIVTSSNPDYGTVTGGGNYEYNEVVEIEAFAYAGCAFEAWSDGSKKNPRFITVKRNMMFQALFSGAYPIRLLDYYGLLQLWSNLQGYAAQKLSTKVDKTQAGDSDTPVYFNSAGIPTPCTALDLNTSGNAASATKLETARKINTVDFDGTTDITLTPSNIGLGNVDNTSDMDKPISTATQNALMVLETDIDKVSYDNITYRMIDDIFD